MMLKRSKIASLSTIDIEGGYPHRANTAKPLVGLLRSRKEPVIYVGPWGELYGLIYGFGTLDSDNIRLGYIPYGC